MDILRRCHAMSIASRRSRTFLPTRQPRVLPRLQVRKCCLFSCILQPPTSSAIVSFVTLASALPENKVPSACGNISYVNDCSCLVTVNKSFAENGTNKILEVLPPGVYTLGLLKFRPVSTLYYTYGSMFFLTSRTIARHCAGFCSRIGGHF